MDISIKELVNAFNLNNCFSDNVYTNFTVEGKKVVGLFTDDINVTKYLRGIREEIIKQQYLGREVVAGKYYNLNCFPFILNTNPSREESDIKGIVKVKLADSTNKEVIRNLKIHLVNEFRRAVTLKLIARLVVKIGITKEEGHEWVGGAVRIGAFDESNLLKKDYLYCIAFDGEYFEREGYDSETFELFKGMYIQEFNSRLRACGLKNSDFYDYKDDMLYIKDVNDKKVVERVAKYVREQVAFIFETPGKEDSKVENFKAVFSNLISEQTGKSINGYDYDVFTDAKEIENGNNFVLIPLTQVYGGQFESLKHKDAYRINAVYDKFVCDIRGKTARSDVTGCKNPVYAFSNGKITEMLSKVMEFPITYNERFGHFEFAADLGPSSSVESPRHGSMAFPVLLLQTGTGVAVPGVVDTKNNPGPSMSGQSSNLLSEPGPLQSVDIMENSSESLDDDDYSLEERVLLKYIGSLPLDNNEKSRQKILSLVFSHGGRQELYSILSSPRERKGLYSDLCISEQCERWESFWYSLHQRKQQPASDKSKQVCDELFFPSVSGEQTRKELYHILIGMFTGEKGYFDVSKAAKVAKSISSSVKLDSSHYCKSYLVEIVEAEMKKLGVTPTSPEYIKPSGLVNGYGPLDVSNLSLSKGVN
ncbi:MAG: hypothetical protein LBC06_02860 [Rickettsiales bacterium]|nr:hypothetical protein [Rickettsiales bacterium]